MLLEVEKLNGLFFRVLMHSLNWICPALWQKCDLHSWSSITGPVLSDFARLERIHLMPPKNKGAPQNYRNQLPQAGRMCSAQGTRGKLWYSPLSINTKSADIPLMVYLYSMNEQICPYPLLLNNCLSFTVNINWITSKFWVQPENINAALFPGHILITVICGILSNWVHNLTCLLQPSYHGCCQQTTVPVIEKWQRRM